MRAIPSALATLLAIAGCVTVPSPPLAERVEVTPAGAALKVAPRAPGCEVQFFRTKPPDRPYDEVAALHLSVFGELDAAAVQEALRARACAAGADAVIVTRDYASIGGYAAMAGVAVSYPELRELHAAAYSRRSEEEARERAARRARQPPGVPASFVEAAVTRHVVLRASAERRSAALGELAVGTAVWVAPVARSGYRRVWVSPRVSAWAEDTDLVLLDSAARGGAAVPAAAPAGAPPAKTAGGE